MVQMVNSVLFFLTTIAKKYRLLIEDLQGAGASRKVSPIVARSNKQWPTAREEHGGFVFFFFKFHLVNI